MSENEINVPADSLSAQCRDDAMKAYGTSFIFQRRARLYRKLVQWITYVGFGVPMVVGLLVLAFDHSNWFPVVIVVATIAGVAQAIFALWAVIGGWVDGASYAIESASANESLATRYSELADSPNQESVDFRHRYELLKVEDKGRTDQDFHQAVRESEKRLGLRAALRKYQAKCVGCEVVPKSMKSSSCEVCGNFRYKLR